jgi:CRP/FNR family cyclic AMP-dependent transcriptional regulator
MDRDDYRLGSGPPARRGAGTAAPRKLPRDEVVRALGATPLFSRLDDAALSQLAGLCGQRTLERGHFLCYQGESGDRLFVIAAGTVKVVLTSERGEEVLLATMGRHESLGELAVLDGSPRSASVVAVEPTIALLLSRPTLLDLMGRHPSVLDAVLTSLGSLVRRLTEQTGDFVFLDLGGRLAKVLLGLSHADAAKSDAAELDVLLSQSELAAMVGASRPAVNRALHLLATRGWISVEGQVIVLRDVESLRRRAGG